MCSTSTLHADTAGGIVQQNNTSRWSLPRRDFAPRWRSMVTALSPTGLDLSHDEFLEFWPSSRRATRPTSPALRLVFDLGTVSEDAIAIAPDTMTVNGADTVFTGRQFVGVGELDTERTDIGIFNAEVDDIGILGDRPPIIEVPGGPIGRAGALLPHARTRDVLIFPWGDLSARCTSGNGVARHRGPRRRQRLNPAGSNENVFRYIVDLAGRASSCANGVTQRDRRAAPPSGSSTASRSAADRVIGTPTLRLVKHLRITFADAAGRRAAGHRRPAGDGAHAVRRLALDPPVGDPDPRA